MKQLNIIDFKIDNIVDDLHFKLRAFNYGKYDPERLRTIVRNTGLELKIENISSRSITLSFIGFLVKSTKSEIYYSSQLTEFFPIGLHSGDVFQAMYYAYSLKKILKKSEDEEFIIIARDQKNNAFFRSNLIQGDNMEKHLSVLEENELSNWGNKDFLTLDKKIT